MNALRNHQRLRNCVLHAAQLTMVVYLVRGNVPEEGPGMRSAANMTSGIWSTELVLGDSYAEVAKCFQKPETNTRFEWLQVTSAVSALPLSFAESRDPGGANPGAKCCFRPGCAVGVPIFLRLRRWSPNFSRVGPNPVRFWSPGGAVGVNPTLAEFAVSRPFGTRKCF